MFYDVEFELANLNGTKRVIVMLPEAAYVRGNDRRATAVASALHTFCMLNTSLTPAQIESLIQHGLQQAEVPLADASNPLVCIISLCREEAGLTADVVALFDPATITVAEPFTN